MSLCKDLLQEQEDTGGIPNILTTVLIIGKHEKSIDFDVALTLLGRQILFLIQCSSQIPNSAFILTSLKSSLQNLRKDFNIALQLNLSG